jgi:hypothetical protein
MTIEKKLVAPKRRTRTEVQQLVTEFVGSGMRRSEFCRSRGLSLSTLSRHLKKQRWKRKSRAASPADRLVPVELAAKKSPTQHEPSCGLVVALSRGRRIEVYPDFDTNTFGRLREKRACRFCEELGVVSAPLPPRIIEKCLASDRIVIDTVIGKYCNHTPLHRQSIFWKERLAWKSAERRWTAGSSKSASC